MDKVNTYGLKIIGLEKASKATVDWPLNCGGYTAIFYKISTGEVWAKDYAGQNDFTVYDDPEIIRICSTTEHMSKQKIADAIKDELEFMDYVRNN